MKIDTKYYGEIEYEENELLIFPDGLFGFSQYHAYLPLAMDEEDTSMLILQSTDEPYVAFFLIDPLSLLPSYAPVLTSEELSFLGVKSSNELSYYAICTAQKDYLDNTVNMRCPLVINPDTRKGLQVILSNADYGYHEPLRKFLEPRDATLMDNRGDEYADSEA